MVITKRHAIIFLIQIGCDPNIIACLLVITITLFHVKNKDISSKFQIAFTSIKILLIISFCFCAFTITPEPQSISFLPQKGDLSIFTSTAFGISLIYVSYAYTGWNAAVYITSELERPQKDLPKIPYIFISSVAQKGITELKDMILKHLNNDELA